MHPLIRIVTFLVAAFFLARGGSGVLLLSAIALPVLYIRLLPHPWCAMVAPVKRLRWLLISMLVVYAWFTPGTPLWSGPGDAMAPTLEGVMEAALRVGILLSIALAAQLLILSTERAQLLSAVYGLALPLRGLGLSRERLALRLALTLDAVPRLNTVLTPSLCHGLSGNAVTQLGQLAARAFQGALQHADRQACNPVEFAAPTQPPVYQWLYPILLGVGVEMIL